MGCCGSIIKTTKNIAVGHSRLTTDFIGLAPKYEFTDSRVRICQQCEKNFWIGRNLFCLMFLRRVGRTLWPDPEAFIPARARVEDEHCPLKKWQQENCDLKKYLKIV